MKISKLSEGMTFKNYKELCLFLDMPIKSGRSKQLQLSDLSRYFIYTKEGQKITITEIFKEPLPSKTDLRGIGNNRKVFPNFLISKEDENKSIETLNLK